MRTRTPVAYFLFSVLAGTMLLSALVHQFAPTETVFMIVSKSFIATIMGAVYYVFGKVYCILVYMLGERRNLVPLFEKVVLPVLVSVLSVQFLYFSYQYESNLWSMGPLMVVFGQTVVWGDLFGLNRRYIYTLRGINEFIGKAKAMSAEARRWTVYSPGVWLSFLIIEYITIYGLLTFG